MTATASYAELSLFIDGEWLGTDGRQTRDVVNPATGEVIGVLPVASTADVERALDGARRAFPAWRELPPADKSAVMYGAAALLRERAEAIALLLTAEQGKPLAESVGEVAFTASILEFFGSQALSPIGTVIGSGGLSRRQVVLPEPVGPVASFTPWNYPMIVPARKIAAALAAGCTTVIKPAEEAPASSSAVVRALIDAGLPRGVVSMVFGDPAAISSQLIRSPIIRKVSFTGPTPVGKTIAALASEGVKPCILELGGHTPVLVFEDVDIDKVARLAVRSKFHNGGQSCGSPSRFYIHESRHDEFVEAFAAYLDKVSVGDPTSDGTDMGPLANPRRRSAIADLVTDAVDQGAQLVRGGHAIDGPGYFYAPTLLANVPEDARIMNEEPFGPVASTASFSTLEEAVHSANRTPYGLGSYVWSADAERARLVSRLIEAGMVGVNRFGLGGSDTFFGGVKESGYGSEGGPEAVADYQVRKLIDEG